MFYNYILYIIHYYLVGGIPTPLETMSSSVGMMKFPTEWKVIKFHGSKPPTSYILPLLTIIHHDQPLSTIINHD